MKYITNVKMQVTPEQTREISKIVLENGGCWNDKTKLNDWLVITPNGYIGWSTEANIKYYSECIAQDWLDDYYSKSPKYTKDTKYNFKFLEENKVAIHIPTVELVEDFLKELSKYRKFELDDHNHGLRYYSDMYDYFVLYEKLYYDSYIKDSIYISDFKNISWANFTSRKNQKNIWNLMN